MIYQRPFPPSSLIWKRLHESYRLSETESVQALQAQLRGFEEKSSLIQGRALSWVQQIRAQELSLLDQMFALYPLTSQEGRALLSLAEALLRIPDHSMRERFITDILGQVSWQSTSSKPTLAQFFAQWGLKTGSSFLTQSSWGVLGKLIRRLGKPLVRRVIDHMVRTLAEKFILGQTMKEALHCLTKNSLPYTRYSLDRLGEEAQTQDDVERYFQAYWEAIEQLDQAKPYQERENIQERPGVSLKLSALHPRYSVQQRERVLEELTPRLLQLAHHAKDHRIQMTWDAEESNRLCLSLELFEKVYTELPWEGLGMAVQAYQRRCLGVIDYLLHLAQKHGSLLSIRLVKGAYWDSEIKETQVLGLEDYPVYTRKVITDVAYLACAKKLLDYRKWVYPQFASHNAHTLAAVLEMAEEPKGFEIQRLQGMGEALHAVISQEAKVLSCVYAPVGPHDVLLPYLARRLLENGANSSFVHQLADPNMDPHLLVQDPLQALHSLEKISHPGLPRPVDLVRQGGNKGTLTYDHDHSQGLDFSDYPTLEKLRVGMEGYKGLWEALKKQIPSSQDAQALLSRAQKAYPAWSFRSVKERTRLIEKWAKALEEHQEVLMVLLLQEGKKTLNDAMAEVREAIDFCRYYAEQACHLMGSSLALPGPTGETNTLSLHSRGVFLCISPWNFPLAIFMGQVVAALVTGNCVLAKPAQATPCIAYYAVHLGYQVGIPEEVLSLIFLNGQELEKTLLQDHCIQGVAMTGSTQTAWAIQSVLSQRGGPLVPLIAETGGLNAMIVDSSALQEKAVRDIIISGFQSAGQRCSALRLLCVQEEIFPSLMNRLMGAMKELNVGDPHWLKTDVGPVIHQKAKEDLEAYLTALEATGAQKLYETPLPAEEGNFIAPQLWKLKDLDELKTEAFGPIVHVISYAASELSNLIERINAKGYGLTLGLHTRLPSTIDLVRQKAQVGNLYINRSMIGAMVGIQPFGGEGLSGTGPKAGGPHYLLRFVVERTVTEDTTAAGGNASLMASFLS